MPRDPGGGGQPNPKRKKKIPPPDGFLEAIGAPKITPGPSPTVTTAGPIDQALRQPPKPPAWALRRQRLLRAAGYPVVVDGIWGPVSQRYWQRYARSGRAPFLPAAEVEQQENTAGREILAEARREAAAAIRGEGPSLTPAQARAAAQRRELEQTQARLRQIGGFRTDPSGIGRLKLEDLAALVNEPDAKFDVRRARDARIVQTWLSERGTAVTVDGVYGKETHDALVAALRSEEQAARRRQVATVTRQFYKHGLIQAGQRPKWWPLATAVPEPGQLVKLLQGGGFTAAIIYRELTQRARNENLEFEAWRYEQLEKMARSLGGPFTIANLNRLAPDGKAIVTAQQLAAEIIASGQLGERERAQAVGQLRAIFGSTDIEGFERRLGAYLAVEEGRFLREQKERAAKLPWWGRALDPLLKPGEFLRDAAVTSVLILADPIEYLRTDESELWRYWEAGAQANEEFAKNHRVFNFVWEALADPLVFVAPLRIGSTGLRLAGVGRGSLGIYRISTETGRVVYDQAAWVGGLRSATGRFLAEGGDTTLTRAIHKGLTPVVRLSRAREDAIAGARARVGSAMRHGFRRRPELGDQAPQDFSIRSKRTRETLDDTDLRVRAGLSVELRGVIDGLRGSGASIWVDAGRETLSDFGAALRARVSEEARVQSIFAVATRAARDKYDVARASGASHDVAVKHGDSEFERVRRAAGSFQRGAGDPEVARAVAKRAGALMDQWEHSLLPAIQDILEEGAVLFDANGRWIGRQAGAQAALRRQAQLTISGDLVELANPLAGHRLTWHAAGELMEDEIARAQGRYLGWVARRRAAGNAISKDTVNVELKRIDNEVRDAWKPVQVEGRTLYQDTRETIQVSSLYARHLDEAFVTERTWRGTLDEAARLAYPPSLAREQPWDQEIGRLMWHLGGGHASGPGRIAERVRATRVYTDDATASVERLRAAVTERQIALARAYEEALPHALKDEWMFLSALAHAQTLPLRALYHAVKFPLDVWIFATLPFRPGWVVRNVVDNTAKALTAGIRDPRAFFYGAQAPGSGVRSIFDFDLRALIYVVRHFDNIFGTDVARPLLALREQIWQQPPDVLAKIFGAHGIEVPEALLERAAVKRVDGRDLRPTAGVSADDVELLRAQGLDELADDADRFRRMTPEEVAAERNWVARFKDGIWELMAQRPENYSKRLIYRDTFRKAVAEGADEFEAARVAWEKVERVLFNYDKLTVAEANLRVVFPFIQFARKNATFWATSFTKPWMPLTLEKFDQARREAQPGLPAWAQRYILVRDVVDAAAWVPGLEWLAKHTGVYDAALDPLSYLSFGQLYRAFKGENLNLPGGGEGMRFIGPMLDWLSDAGLGMNPFVRKPLEGAGIASQRAWQTVFPQTSVADGITRRFFGDGIASKVRDWERVFTLGQGDTPSETIAENFDEYVQLEMAGQAARGEPINRAAAEATIRAWFFVQNTVGYFAGAYLRRMTPEDVQLGKLSEDVSLGKLDYRGLTEEEKELLKLYRMRNAGSALFDDYVALIPAIRAYYRQPDWEARERYKQEHPEILAFVDPAWKGRPWSRNYVKTAALVLDTDAAFRLSKLTDTLDLDFETAQLARQALVTPELEKFWAGNDTPKQIRDRMIQGEWYGHLFGIQASYFAIPESDREGRAGFLAEHPELQRFWQRNNSDADDYKLILQSANADLRDRYFEILQGDGGEPDWEAAAGYIREHPFIFEWTSAEDRIDPQTGRWAPKPGTEKARDFAKAKRYLDHYFALPEHRRGEWLRSNAEGAALVRAYFAKYPSRTRSQHARDYLVAKKWLDVYFGMPEDRRGSWLEGDSEGARIVRAYFDTYANGRGQTQHGRDYLVVKDWLDHYFSLPKGKRNAWLNSGAEGTSAVLRYFQKYGRTHRYERAFRSLKGGSGRPELNLRIQFWQRYFDLPPDQRAAFVQRNAERYGIFVYGALGEQERHEREQQYLRQALAAGVSRRASAWLYARPLLDFYFTLTDEREKLIFRRANPEITEYLDKWANASPSGNAKTDKLLDAYFKLPYDSDERTAFLRAHPEVQRYFDKRSTPAERALHRLLEVYFALPYSGQRREFLSRHPEISEYFDRRARERDLLQDELSIFDQVDPRLEPFRQGAQDIWESAEWMRERLALSRVDRPEAVESRRERRPE